jgi:DNA-binding MarR family transcriptional regulator
MKPHEAPFDLEDYSGIDLEYSRSAKKGQAACPSVANSCPQGQNQGATGEVPGGLFSVNLTMVSAGLADSENVGMATQPTMLYLLKQVELAARSQLDDLLRPAEVTALQYTALTVLERRPGLSSAQLARNSFVTTQSMADMVTVLLDRGLIDRHRDPADRRRLVIGLTAAGQELIRQYRGKIAELERQMLAGLDEQQAGELRRYLVACRLALSGGSPH